MVDAATSARTEISEEDAEGKVKAVYDDIKVTLRVPIVNLIFRILASQHPDYLQVAWRALQPNVRTLYFEKQSDQLRRRAVEGMISLGGTPPSAGGADAATVLRVFHYINPKLLLIVAALRSATVGQQPKLQELPAEDKRQMPLGIPEGAQPLRMVDPAEADERVSALFADIQQTLGLSVLNSDYRALAVWPDFLESAWHALKPVTQQAEYRTLQRELMRAAGEVVTSLPFRMELNPHTLRHCGMSEQDIDGVRATLDRFHQLLPGLVANVSFFASGVLGRDQALLSPFPPEGL